MIKYMFSFFVFSLVALSQPVEARESVRPGPMFYREFTKKIRPKGEFRVFMPGGNHQDISYSFEMGAPIYREPMINDFKLDPPKNEVIRSFWDRVWLKDGSYLEVGGERVPLTCIFVRGQDNRFNGVDSPLFPEFIIRVYLVANDFACQGPLRPGWPSNGGKKENWDTYLLYEVRDPTIMLPQDIMIRYRWNESEAVLMDRGRQ